MGLLVGIACLCRAILEQVASLPASIGSLSKLEMLNVASNKIESVPPLTGLVSLKRLAMFWNKITDMPPLEHMKDLEEIQVRSSATSTMMRVMAVDCLDWEPERHPECEQQAPCDQPRPEALDHVWIWFPTNILVH